MCIQPQLVLPQRNHSVHSILCGVYRFMDWGDLKAVLCKFPNMQLLHKTAHVKESFAPTYTLQLLEWFHQYHPFTSLQLLVFLLVLPLSKSFHFQFVHKQRSWLSTPLKQNLSTRSPCTNRRLLVSLHLHLTLHQICKPSFLQQWTAKASFHPLFL